MSSPYFQKLQKNSNLAENFNDKCLDFYQSFGFNPSNKIQLDLGENTLYYKKSNWILAHKFKKYDFIRYYYQIELFKRDIPIYQNVQEYLWLSCDLEKEILLIEKKVLTLFQENLKEDFRDYQLKKLFIGNE
jgi:hypothetical protein